MANRVRAKIKTLRVSPTDETKLKRKEVNAIGRNVNQIVRYIHETGTVEPEAFEMLRQEIKEMNKVIMTEFKEGNLLKENANYESTTNQED